MTRKKWTLLTSMMLVVLLVLPVMTGAQPLPRGSEGEQPDETMAVAGDLTSGFYYQGVLTEAGSPVNGTRQMEFELYDASSGGSQVGSTITQAVVVTGGQFNVAFNWGRDRIDGKALWLQVRARDSGGSLRDLGRTQIRAVPYAMSLVPGAWVRARSSVKPYALFVEHTNTTSGIGLSARSKSSSPAIKAEGASGGVAIRASGSGVIQSTAKSYVWISGNGVRPYHQSDTTIIDMDTMGGAITKPGTGSGNRRNVMLPITVPGPLYGQDVTISALDIYWNCRDSQNMGISAVLLRRQTGVGSYDTIVHDSTDYTCGEPDGCTIHHDLTSNNVLTADSGILYLTLELAFLDADSWIQVGGVRLTLEHD
ncbi:MAG: hypothetical protein ACE5LU_02715 [Anaerolineae bacterium]